MKIQLLRFLDDAGPCDMREIVLSLRVSVRCLKPALDALVSSGEVYAYSVEDYEHDSGETVHPDDRDGFPCYGTRK